MNQHAICALVLGLGVGCESEVCSAGALEDALALATPGTVVDVGACAIDGQFSVPTGVTLRGAGATETILRSATGTVLELGSGSAAEALRVEAQIGLGIRATGGGALTLTDLDVVHSGVGVAAIGVSGASETHLTNVNVTGPVTEANAIDVPDPASKTNTALYGVLVIGPTDSQFNGVSVRGFGVAGVVTSGGSLDWSGSSTVEETLGIGVWIDGGNARLEDLTIQNVLIGFRGFPSYGLATGGGATIETLGMTVDRTQSGFGVIHDGGAIVHTGLSASGHAAGGVLAQRTSEFTMMGGELSANNLAGLMLVDAAAVTLQSTSFHDTISVDRMMGDWGTVMIGDGLLLAQVHPGTVLEDLDFTGNERAGLVIDLDGGNTGAVQLNAVTANASGTAYGVVVQNGTAAMGWDADVTREGSAVTNDPLFTGGLDIVGVIGPTDLPSRDSLAGVIGPTD